MAKDEDGNETSSSVDQSKRSQQSQPAAQDSDSQQSDLTSTHTTTSAHQSSSHHPHRPRVRSQKHTAGGGAGRLHARVPSSKGLQKHTQAAAASAAAVAGTAGTEAGGQTKRPQIQRRVTAEARPSRDSSSVNLRKNLSQTTLKRNSRSHTELAKKNTAARLKRSESHASVQKLKSHKTQVHFDLENKDEEEWVDASGSTSPYLSRRTSIANASSHPPNTPSAPAPQLPSSPRTTKTEATAATTSASTLATGKAPEEGQEATAREFTNEHAKEPDPATSQHKQYLTTRVLQRIPSYGAVPPKMSSETVQVPMHPRSPEQQHGSSRQSSTLSGTPHTSNTLPSSNRDDEVSSRFINSSTSAANEGSFYASADGASHERRRTNGNTNGPRRPLSVGSLAHARRGDTSPVGNEDNRERVGEGHLSQPSRRSAPAPVSRTQQKLNLQRASSSLEPSPAHGGGIGGPSPLITGASDPRAGKMLERTGMEYLVVRRYQNPVARSIARLNQVPGTERSRRIPHPTSTDTSTSRMSGPLGLGQSFRQPSDLQSRPVTPHRGGQRQNGTVESSFDGQEEELSGASLVENSHDGTTALLRLMWDRRMDFASASQ